MLNDKITDPPQKLVRKSQDNMQLYQSVLNIQKKKWSYYSEHPHLMHSGKDHWPLTLCFNGLIQVYDNLYGTVTNETIGYMKVFYSLSFNKKCQLNFRVYPDQHWTDEISCGLFVIAFAADMWNNNVQCSNVYCATHEKTPRRTPEKTLMREHLIQCL